MMDSDDKALQELEAMYASDDDTKKKKPKGGKKAKAVAVEKGNVTGDGEGKPSRDETVDDKVAGKQQDKNKSKKSKAKKVEQANKTEASDVTDNAKSASATNGSVDEKSKERQDDKKPLEGGDKQNLSLPTETNSTDDKNAEAKQEQEDLEDGQEKEMSAAKRKKLKKKEKEKEKKAAGGTAKAAPVDDKKKPSGMAKLIKAQLERQREEEIKRQREEEEEERKREEARRLKEEQEQLEKEKKERKKQKEKERKARLKSEGKLLTDKQKKDRQRMQQMLEHIKDELPPGHEPGVPDAESAANDDKKKKPKYQRLKRRPQVQVAGDENQAPADSVTEKPDVIVEDKPEKKDDHAESWEDAANDTWNQMEAKETWDDEDENESDDDKEGSDDEAGSEEESTERQSGSSSSGEESGEDSDDDVDPIERARQRIHARRESCVAKRDLNVLRCALVCVLGHVDTGKTSILDKLRRTHVQDGEAGGITQQIGATNVPSEAILSATRMVKSFQQMAMLLPGLLVIDTPGHESFSNLRSRGSGLCDVAILVVDLMHGIEPQTVESIKLLKDRKTPFVVALNKIDRLYSWQTNPTADVFNTIKRQSAPTIQDFKDRVKQVIAQFAMHEINVCLANENKNSDEYASLVPTSAHTGDGMGNLLASVCELCLKSLKERLAFHEDLEATVMEVKEIQGLGTTLDVCLVNGRLHEGETIVLAGQEGPIVTQIRGLLMPQPMKELRVKNPYDKFKEVKGALAVKVIAKDLEKSLAGLPLYASKDHDEIEVYKQDVSRQLRSVLKSIEVSDAGVYVQASTLGSLEALLEYLKNEKIPFSGINIGPVHKRDVMKASVMVEKDVQWAVILAFDVKVEREAQEMADSYGVKVFTADIIYHLSDAFMKWREDRIQAEREKFRQLAVFPCKLRILPQYIFNSRDPIVCGVTVEAGILRHGTPISVPSKDCVFLGRIDSVERDHKKVDEAKKGSEVCIKIVPPPGDAPKMYGRHFDHNDLLMSRVSRDSIDTVKKYFRDDLSKEDWKLMVELKKAFSVV